MASGQIRLSNNVNTAWRYYSFGIVYISNFVVSEILKEYLHMVTAVFRDVKFSPARCPMGCRTS